RDEHRHDWMRAALDVLLAARPDTVVVEMGVPPLEGRGAGPTGHRPTPGKRCRNGSADAAMPRL
ncbi:hypothetical protein ACWC21_19235, partial [Streptomyces sp. NPDC001348]